MSGKKIFEFPHCNLIASVPCHTDEYFLDAFVVPIKDHDVDLGHLAAVVVPIKMQT